MTKKQILEAALDYFGVATFPAYAGDNCRCCPRARDGGCNDPHDEDCRYGRAEKALKAVLEAEGLLKRTEERKP